MIRRFGLMLAVAGLLLGGAVRADDASDAADIAFWQSIANSQQAAEFEAYLRAFPQGKFVKLAQIRIKALAGGAATPQAPKPTTPEPPEATQTAETPKVAAAKVTPTKAEFRAIDRIAVEVDARALRRGSNWRVAVVPAGTPVEIIDRNAFAAISEPIKAAKLRLSLDPAPSGADEVRVYYIPQYGKSFALAGSAPVTVGDTYPGATIVQDLTAEAAALGALRFEAKHRDQPILVEGEFLRLDTRVDSDDIFELLAGKADNTETYVAVYLGHRGTVDKGDAPTELVCFMPSDERGVLDRLAKLNLGDDVVLAGIPTTWGQGVASDAVVLDPCRFPDQ